MNDSGTRRLAPVMLIPMLLVTICMVAGSVVTAPPAQASLCTTSSMDGTWSNADPGTRSITKALVYCGDDSRTVCEGDVCTRTFGVARFVQLWGSCSPTDCDWGVRKLTPGSDGYHTAYYDQGFATRSVWVRTENWYGRVYLRVSIWTDYRDSRTDKWTTDWFLK